MTCVTRLNDVHDHTIRPGLPIGLHRPEWVNAQVSTLRDGDDQ